MSSRIQRLLAPPTEIGIMAVAGPGPQPGVLAITADVRLYANVLNAASSLKWRISWARTMERAIEMSRPWAAPIVIYDANLPGIEWGEAFLQLREIANRSRVLLATTWIDEDLWQEVLRRNGYDIVERSAGSEELIRVFRFAWLSLHTPAEV